MLYCNQEIYIYIGTRCHLVILIVVILIYDNIKATSFIDI